ncbi:RrF2 family transcriptional regulator [Spongiimicrobium salis]|uniref:RrF2 family transcriptional regulator n=1 Tax=Spongiimicrobium salis TaxID=1667022 RepID=UPI00374D110A
MIKSSLSTHLHIMTLLSIYDKDWNSSSDIAGSININPVLVRKELKLLKQANLIESKEGKHGGVRLAKSAKDIYLSDIFKAIKDADHIFEFRTESPNPSCLVGQQINTRLSELFESIDQAVITQLEGMSLKEFANRF